MGARIRSNFQVGSLSAAISDSATSLSSAGFAFLPVVSGGNTLTITLDPDRDDGPEDMFVITGHALNSTTATGTRVAPYARSHVINTKWVGSVYAEDFAADQIPSSGGTSNVQVELDELRAGIPTGPRVSVSHDGPLDIGASTLPYVIDQAGDLPDLLYKVGVKPVFGAAEWDIKKHLAGTGPDDAGTSIFTTLPSLDVGEFETTVTPLVGGNPVAVDVGDWLSFETVANGGPTVRAHRAGSYEDSGDAATGNASSGLTLSIPAAGTYELHDDLFRVIGLGGTNTPFPITLTQAWTVKKTWQMENGLWLALAWKECTADPETAPTLSWTNPGTTRQVLDICWAVGGAIRADEAGNTVFDALGHRLHGASPDPSYTAGGGEVQTLTFDATGGTYTLTFQGQTTGSLTYANTTGDTATILAALEGLSNIAVGDVTVVRGTPSGNVTTFIVIFKGAFLDTEVTQMTSTETLTGGSGTLTHATTTPIAAHVTSENAEAVLYSIFFARYASVNAGSTVDGSSGTGTLAGADSSHQIATAKTGPTVNYSLSVFQDTVGGATDVTQIGDFVVAPSQTINISLAALLDPDPQVVGDLAIVSVP